MLLIWRTAWDRARQDGVLALAQGLLLSEIFTGTADYRMTPLQVQTFFFDSKFGPMLIALALPACVGGFATFALPLM